MSGALPTGWAECPLASLAAAEPGSFVDGPFGSNLKTAHYTESGPRVIRLENVGDGEFRDIKTHITREHFRRLHRHEACARDVVIALLGEKVPRACVVPDDVGPAIVKADCPRLRTDPDLALPEFVAIALNSEQIRGQAKALIHGVGRPRLKLLELRELTIPLPPLPEQRRIIEVLDTYLTRLNSAVTTLDRVRAHLRRHRAAVLQEATDGTLAGAAGWPTTTLGEVLASPLCHGKSVRTRDDGFPVLRLNAIRNGRIDLAERKGGDWTLEDARTVLVEPGDFLVARGNGSIRLVGRGGLAPGRCDAVAFPDTMIRVRARCDVVLPRFLALLWDAPSVRRQIETMAKTTAGIHKINQRDMSSIVIPLPTLPEQEVTLRESDRHLSVIEAAERLVIATQSRASLLRRSLLRTAVDGGLVRQNPRDEPATALIERIGRERAGATHRKDKVRSGRGR